MPPTLKLLVTLLGPYVLMFVAWRRIEPRKRTTVWRVIFVGSAVLYSMLLVYVVVQGFVIPRLKTQTCEAAWLALDHAKNPTMTELAFSMRCETLSLEAARCTNATMAAAPQCAAQARELSETFVIPLNF